MAKTKLNEKVAFTLAEGATHVGISDNYRKSAFTLAEVLITLGIIGIVSAMTIPTLVKNYQEKILISKAKQADAQIKNAVKMYMVNNNCYDKITCLFDTNKTSHQVIEELATVFKSAEVCPDVSNGQQKKKCKTYSIKGNTPSTLNGKYINEDSIENARIILKNGMIIAVKQYNSCIRVVETPIKDEFGYETGEVKQSVKDYCALLYIDTNGLDKPNQMGRDAYVYDAKSNGKFTERYGHIKNAIKNNKLIYTDYEVGTDVPQQE